MRTAAATRPLPHPDGGKGFGAKFLITLLAATLLAAPLAACGKKGALDVPEGSTYPRQYPPPK